jgi:glycerate 2-kinase
MKNRLDEKGTGSSCEHHLYLLYFYQMIIKNRYELETNTLRRSALDILEAGIESVLPDVILPKTFSLNAGRNTITINGKSHNFDKRLFVVGGGKASGALAETLETLLPENAIIDDLVTCKGGGYNTCRINVVTAGHPIPDERGVIGSKTIAST